MKLIIAFFMAWGNFITLPCPYKRWDGALKNLMLAFLPSVGAVVAGLWCLLAWALQLLHLPITIQAIALEFYLFAICGFMHLDGFMDCNDAILSRRPLEERQRILKDSNVGAFAVVTLVFLLIAQFTCMVTLAMTSGPARYLFFFLLPILSRGSAGLQVMDHRPIGHSQYKEDWTRPKGGDRAASLIQMGVYIAAAFGIAAYVIRYSVNYSTFSIAGAFGTYLMIPLGALTVCVVTGLIAGTYARRQLGGMSGDIAGYVICWSELGGCLAMSVLVAL